MGAEFTSTQPIYLQLVLRISKQIVRGDVALGEKLPSVRDMAIESGVNPNTIARVYTELERMDIVQTRRGQGTFVTESHERLSRLRAELKQEQVENFIRDMREMGFSDEEVLAGLVEYLKK